MVSPSPETAVHDPNAPWLSVAVSFAVWVVFFQAPLPGLVNTYAAPRPSRVSVAGAPATTVPPSPEIATDLPNWSPDPPSVAVSSAVCVEFCQPPLAGSLKTYAAPCCEACPAAPTTIVSPSADTATEVPKLSSVAPSLAVSSAVGVAFCQPPLVGSVNT